VAALRLARSPIGHNREVSTVTFTVFTVSNRCPVCGGDANSRYQPALSSTGPRMDRKCSDCGFTWVEKSVRRSL
jgi:DNA-directed RNA polymerase subunit M/transcription elongation factor TFIIS